MSAQTSGGVVDHRAAAAALDRVADLIDRRAALDVEIDAAVRDALATLGVTQTQVAGRMGMSARGLRKRLAGGNAAAATDE